MGTLTDILSIARNRAESLDLPYAGALTPREAFEIWQSHTDTVLVDIRTRAELDWVGRIPGALEIEWQSYPEGLPNSEFLTELSRAIPQDKLVLFICRSGVRSHNAACLATEVGYKAAYNVLEGFEGGVDGYGQRGKLGGWRFAGLPWQS